MVFALVFVMGVPALAEGEVTGEDDGATEESGGYSLEGEEYATVVFNNLQIQSPDLYVTKAIQTVEGDDTDYSDVDFSFTLWLNGSLARQQTYTLWDETGTQIYENTAGEQSADPTDAIILRTSRYGVFSIKAGQTARFEDIGTGVEYTVEEYAEDGWVQILPSGGAAAEGVITSTGSVASFMNLATATPSTMARTSGINVYKTASFPDGWTLAADPDFTFQITIDGSAFSLEKYDIYNHNTGAWTGSDYTDSEGKFTIKAGEYASFETDVDADYTVSEILDGEAADEGWRITTAESFSGSTGYSAPTLVFNNAIASFIVTKKLVGDLPGDDADDDDADDGDADDGTDIYDTEFTFVLSDGDGHLWSGATYWLYDIDGNPQYDANGNVISLTTDGNGEFTLKANEAAVFYGIDGGTAYSVKEKAQSDWSQVVPSLESGYSRTVSDAVEVLPFENEYVDITGSLAVTKNISASDGDLPGSEMDFSFYLYKMDGSGNATPVSNAVYSIHQGGNTYSYATGSDGKFTLHDGQTAVFAALSVGTNYGVAEGMSSTVKYALESVSLDGEVYSGDDGEPLSAGDVFTGVLTEDGLAYVFTNGYYASLTDPDPEEEPDDPTTPDEVDESTDPEPEEEPEEPDGSGILKKFSGFTLPEVGGRTFKIIIIIGVACVVVGVILFKKKKPEDE